MTPSGTGRDELEARVETLERLVFRLAQALANSEFSFIEGEDGLGWGVSTLDTDEFETIAGEVLVGPRSDG